MSPTRMRILAAAGILACLPLGQMIAAERSIAAMSQAATRFLAELTPEQRQQATFPMNADERLRWHFIPNEMFPRKGLAFRAMTEAQRARAHDLLKSGLSQRGYVTATSIIQLENVLRAIENGGKMARDPLDYQFTVFGTPGAKDAWGWRVEGHHLSLHFTIAGGTAVASSPTFTGSNPAEVRDGPEKGKRVLAPLEDLGRALVIALDAGQRAKAVLDAAAPGDIVTMNKNDITPLSPDGAGRGGDDRRTAGGADAADRSLHVGRGRRPRGRADGEAQGGGPREDHVRLGRSHREGRQALLPRAGPDVPHRVRQHAERRQPHPRGVARLSPATSAATCCASTCGSTRTEPRRS